MADIALTAAQIGLVDPVKSQVESYIAAEAITKGQAVYITTTGTAGVADANAAGKQQFRGIALQSVGAGQAVDVCHNGLLYGFTISGLNADALAYLSDTAGALADAAGTMSVVAGRVKCLTDKAGTKVLRIVVPFSTTWA